MSRPLAAGLRGRAGFTMVELLVALVATALVVAAVYEATASVSEATARLRSARVAALEGASARAALERWLRAASPDHPMVGVARRGGGESLDELSFGVRHGGPLHPGPQRLRLRVDRDPHTPVRGLVLEIAPLRGEPLPAETLQVAAAAGGMEVRYRTRIAGREQWLSWWDRDGLPEAVELTLLPAAEAVALRDGALPRLLELPILAPLYREKEQSGDESPQPAGLRFACRALGIGTGRCAGP